MSNQAIRLWGGRFRKPPSPALMALSSAATQHARLVPYDILGSIAHAEALEASGVITGRDRDAIVAALAEIRRDVAEGRIAPETFDEDIHTFLERVLIERIGSTGAKLRAGRSRNDQAVNDLKLYLRVEALLLAERLAGLAGAITSRAEAFEDTPCPGFTHLQIAQPVTFGHLLMAHAQPLARDIERLRDWHARSGECPLGAAALAGTAFPGKPGETARILGYQRQAENSIDAVGARDHVAEFLFVTAMIATNISRLSEEITLWASRQFGWIVLDDGFATGSSIMPQKKNPDIAEIARGRAARLIGDLMTMLVALKGLPLAYNRDLAEDKRAAFDACDVLEQVIRHCAGSSRPCRSRRSVSWPMLPKVSRWRPNPRIISRRSACLSQKRTRFPARWCDARRKEAFASTNSRWRISRRSIPVSGPIFWPGSHRKSPLRHASGRVAQRRRA